jgi:hypothetical protein
MGAEPERESQPIGVADAHCSCPAAARRITGGYIPHRNDANGDMNLWRWPCPDWPPSLRRHP